ncbi:invasion associated locus B family protein [Agrobacterium sp. LAD9]|uniref:invasion associated locus B family protein n=1 Tax=Agrobacterium sp. LAD9 TaxID=2055153 RepID=UPI000D1E4C4F|nr:invasion associated locus B family protein [Agrobacterium sp. LAD9]
MKRTLLTVALLSIAPLAVAEEVAPLEQAPAEKPAINRFMVRAPIVDPGETIDIGDILTVTRGFDMWSLGCSVRISSGRRSCSIEQVVMDSQQPIATRSSVRWGIGSSVANKSLLFVHVTSNFFSEGGMRMSFAGVEKTIPQQEWFCSDQGCIVGLPFEGILQSAVQSSQEIGFAYKVKGPNGEAIDIDLRGHMAGFEKALQIAATNPFAPAEPEKKAVPEKVADAAPAKAAAASQNKSATAEQQAKNNPPAHQKRRQQTDKPRPKSELY